MIGALGDCCASGCPLSFDLAPLIFAGFDLELVLSEAAMLVAADTTYHSAAD